MWLDGAVLPNGRVRVHRNRVRMCRAPVSVRERGVDRHERHAADRLRGVRYRHMRGRFRQRQDVRDVHGHAAVRRRRVRRARPGAAAVAAGARRRRPRVQPEGRRRVHARLPGVLQPVDPGRPVVRRVLELQLPAAADLGADAGAEALQPGRPGRLQRVPGLLLKVDSGRAFLRRVLQAGVPTAGAAADVAADVRREHAAPPPGGGVTAAAG